MTILEMKKLVESKGIKWTTYIKLSPRAKKSILKNLKIVLK